MTGQNLTDLPLDIYTVIFSFLGPIDLMAIGQSCKALHSVCSLHTIWKEALRRTISRNLIFDPTFTFQHSGDTADSMTLQELQHASTAPSRIVKLLEGKQRKKCFKNRKLRPLYKVTVPLFPEDTFEEWIGVFLVPGGRYVVTRSDQRLMVIDLERFSCTSRSNLPTKDEPVDPTQYVAYHLSSTAEPLIAAPSPDGTKLRILVSKNDSSEFDTFLVCEYDPSIHKLSALSLLSLDINRRSQWCDPVMIYLTASLFAILEQNVVYVCDFVRGTYSSWDVDPAHQFDSILTTGNKIVLTGHQTVGVWDIPPLLSAPTFQSQEYQSQNPPLRVHVPRIIHPPSHILSTITSASVFPTEAYESSRFYMFMGDWYSRTPESLVFDILEHPVEKPWKPLAFRQQIYLPDAFPAETSGGGQEQVGHINLVGCYNLMDTESMYWKRHRMFEGRIMSFWVYADSTVYILMTPGPGPLPSRPDISSSDLPPEAGQAAHSRPDKRAIHPNVAVEIGDMEGKRVELDETSFDPTSGRLCILASSQASLLVQEFLRLPRSVMEKRHCGRIIDDGFKFGWEEIDERSKQLGNKREEQDLFEDVTDDERFYDHRLEDDDLGSDSSPHS